MTKQEREATNRLRDDMAKLSFGSPEYERARRTYRAICEGVIARINRLKI